MSTVIPAGQISLEQAEASAYYELNKADWMDENREAMEALREKLIHAEHDVEEYNVMAEAIFETKNREAKMYRNFIWDIPLDC